MTQSYNLSQLANNLDTAGRLDATDGLVGAVPPANGGTGQASYTVGDILYASGATALAKLSDVATGNALISGGPGVAPSYGKIGLATHVSGTLPVASGGTGATTLTANSVLIGAGTSAVTSVAPGPFGYLLTSTGTVWQSNPPLTLAYDQVWTNVTASRANNTTYTNSTFRPIMVVVTSGVVSAGINVVFTVGGVQVPFTAYSAQSAAGYSGGTVVVPVGATYSCVVGTVNSWLELR